MKRLSVGLLVLDIVLVTIYLSNALTNWITESWWWLWFPWFTTHLLFMITTRSSYEHWRGTGNYRSAYPSASNSTDTAFPTLTIRAVDPSTGVEGLVFHETYYQAVWSRKRMKERQQDEPVKGWKIANAYFNERTGQVLFTPTVQNLPYGPEEYSKCAFVEEVYERLDVQRLKSDGWEVTDDHGPVPSTQCTCGFYAMNEMVETTGIEPSPWATVVEGARPELVGMTYAGMALLEVELFGRVIKAQRGYRAEYQRVLCVYTYPPEGQDESYPKPPVQVDWKWISVPVGEQPF